MSEIGRLVPLAMVALGNAAVDLENGTLPGWQRHELASALDNLSTSLRQPEEAPTIVEGSESR